MLFLINRRKKCIVWITLREQESSFVIEIYNNGQTFNGDPGQIFQKGKHFGGTGHTGYGLYYAKCICVIFRMETLR